MRAAVAQVWGAPVARTAKMNFPDCDKCRGEAELRAQWGCDAPSERVVFRTTCSLCSGSGCDGCEDGYMEHRRCPTAVLRAESGELVSLRRALSAYTLFAEHGVLPCPDRGFHLQSAQFVQACEVFGNERARWQKVERDYIESQTRRPMTKESA